MYRVASFPADRYDTVRAASGDRRAPRKTTVTAARIDGLAAELDTVGRRPDTLRELFALPVRDPPEGVDFRLDDAALRTLRSACGDHAAALAAGREVGPLLDRWDEDAQQWFTPAERRLAGGYELLRTLGDVADVALDAGVDLRVSD